MVASPDARGWAGVKGGGAGVGGAASAATAGVAGVGQAPVSPSLNEVERPLSRRVTGGCGFVALGEKRGDAFGLDRAEPEPIPATREKRRSGDGMPSAPAPLPARSLSSELQMGESGAVKLR